MRIDTGIAGRLLLALRDDKSGYNDFISFNDEHDVIDQFIKKHALGSIDTNGILLHQDWLFEEQLTKRDELERLTITALGRRFLCLLVENSDVLLELQTKLGSTFDLYTPNQLLSLAIQVSNDMNTPF